MEYNLAASEQEKIRAFGHEVATQAGVLLNELSANGECGEMNLSCIIAKRILDAAALFLVCNIDERIGVAKLTDGVSDLAYEVVASAIGKRVSSALQQGGVHQ